ncbi:MAG: glycosyl hydrolase [Chthoniobacteraceae bacterium]
MNIARLLAFFVLLLAAPSDAQEKSGAAKKGVSGGIAVARALKAAWYYNWGPKGESEPGIEFVPMVKVKSHANDATLAAIKASGAKTLLTFNEPERADQGNVTVEEALELWPKLEATGLRLSSPAPSSDAKGMAWLEQFMEAAKKRKLRVDFIAVHYYRSANENEFAHWLDGLHRKWGRPIWVTEFSGYFTKGDRDRFAEMSFNMLGRNHAVERFAYMDVSPGTPGALWQDAARTQPSKLGVKLRDR